MDPVLRLVHLCEEVIEAGTMVPGHWAESQRHLVNFCRETLQELGDQMARPCQRKIEDGEGRLVDTDMVTLEAFGD